MARTARQSPEGGKAQRVYLLLRDEIVSGEYPVGATLPGEHRLAEMYGVSRVTIRRAMDVLVADGLVQRRIGAGSVVQGPALPQTGIAADFATLMPQLVRMGQETTARLLSYAYVSPPPAVAGALNTTARVQRAVRVRSIDGAPFSHLTTHVPESIAQNFSEADLATTPLFRLLERSGVQVERADQAISATLATPDVAEALDLAPGSALIALTRVVYDQTGRGIEHLSALYRPDRFRLEMTLNRVGSQGARQWAPSLASVPTRGGAE
ncbi:MAG: GntR family transcriptional regulator [Rhodobacteraceae bacterium]|jgi:GntR family transcriptional regulator|nr:GntR family transcriptional regulator [Paracoccaceae bacterium]